MVSRTFGIPREAVLGLVDDAVALNHGRAHSASAKASGESVYWNEKSTVRKHRVASGSFEASRLALDSVSEVTPQKLRGAVSSSRGKIRGSSSTEFPSFHRISGDRPPILRDALDAPGIAGSRCETRAKTTMSDCDEDSRELAVSDCWNEEPLQSPSSRRVYDLLRRIEEQVNTRTPGNLATRSLLRRIGEHTRAPPNNLLTRSVSRRSVSDRKISVMSVFSHHSSVGGLWSQDEEFTPAGKKFATRNDVGTQTEKRSFQWIRTVRSEFLPVPPPSYIPPPNKRCVFSPPMGGPYPSIRMYRPAAPLLLPRGLVRLRRQTVTADS